MSELASGALAGRVAVITGAGGGLGREYALLFAREGASLVLTDLPSPTADDPLASLVEQIVADGGRAVAHRGDIAAESTGEELVAQAVQTFGQLDVLVNNAGNFREGLITDASVADFDAVTRVHLRGHFLTTRAAGRYWRGRAEQGRPVSGSLINTTSRSALNAIAGHGLYGAAKGGIVVLSMIAAKEFADYGVRVNCVAPFARTAMTAGISILAGNLNEAGTDAAFDPFEPANVAPAVAYLASADCPLTGELLFAHGGVVQRYRPWTGADELRRDRAWTIAELAERLSGRAPDGSSRQLVNTASEE